jgi:superoxide reductase
MPFAGFFRGSSSGRREQLMNRQKLAIYRCPVCETVIEVLDPCGLELICCGPQMVPVPEHGYGQGMEHLPMISRMGNGVQVIVGDGRHPTDGGHRIAWIEVVCDGKTQRQFIEPGQWPVAFFETSSSRVSARAYCTVDGLWKAELLAEENSGLLWPELQPCCSNTANAPN